MNVDGIVFHRVSTNNGKKPRTNNQETSKKLRITANNRVIIRGICNYHKYFRINILFAGFFLLNTSRILKSIEIFACHLSPNICIYFFCIFGEYNNIGYFLSLHFCTLLTLKKNIVSLNLFHVKVM